MGRRKKIVKARSFESSGGMDGKTDTFVRLYSSMIHSPAFKALSHRQKSLYLYLKEQFYGHRKPSFDYPDMMEVQGEEFFYFPFTEAVDSGIYTKNMKREFYGDMHELVEFGFIEIAYDGNRRRKTIYRYSGKWSTYSPP